MIENNNNYQNPLHCNENVTNLNQIHKQNIYKNNNSFSCNEEKHGQWNDGFGGHYDGKIIITIGMDNSLETPMIYRQIMGIRY